MSLRPEIFVAMERHCRATGQNMSAFVEKSVARELRVAGALQVSREDALAYLDAKRAIAIAQRKDETDDADEIMGQFFTF